MLHRTLGLVFERGWCNNEQAWPGALGSGPEGGAKLSPDAGAFLLREREREREDWSGATGFLAEADIYIAAPQLYSV